MCVEDWRNSITIALARVHRKSRKAAEAVALLRSELSNPRVLPRSLEECRLLDELACCLNDVTWGDPGLGLSYFEEALHVSLRAMEVWRARGHGEPSRMAMANLETSQRRHARKVGAAAAAAALCSSGGAAPPNSSGGGAVA